MMDNYPSQLTTLQKRVWVSAHILYTNNIYAALAGPPIAIFYGTNPLWGHAILLVNDHAFEDACKILHANGYKDASVDEHTYQLLQQPKSDPDGKKAVKWRWLSPETCQGGPIILAPASHWHFEVTDDTTIIVDGMRFPKFSSYLRALVSLLVQRAQSSITLGYYRIHAQCLWSLEEKYPNSSTELSPADRFLLEHFFSVQSMHNHKKLAELWDGLNRGVLTVEKATALVPIENRPKVPIENYPKRHRDGVPI